MPTARELLEQADALMRRNRAGAINTEVPEHPATIPAAVSPPPSPMVLDDVPELTDAVEEIEIASIADLPDDGDAQSEWLHVDRDARTLTGAVPDSIGVVLPAPGALARHAELAAPGEAAVAAAALEATEEAIAAVPVASEPEPEAPSAEIAAVPAVSEPGPEAPPTEIAAVPAVSEPEPEALPAEIAAAPADDLHARQAPPEEGDLVPAGDLFAHEAPRAEIAALPTDDLAEREAASGDRAGLSSEPRPTSVAVAEGDAVPLRTVSADPGDDWARWQALAEEIRMQVLQRIDIFTDTALREQLAAHLQPIVDRASAEMIATINQQVGALLRAYIAEAIEREIDKWRKGNS